MEKGSWSMSKIRGVTCSTKDGVFVVVGTRDEVRTTIFTAEQYNDSWVALTCLNDEMKERKVDIRVADIRMIGDEQELEVPEPKLAHRTVGGHVKLGETS